LLRQRLLLHVRSSLCSEPPRPRACAEAHRRSLRQPLAQASSPEQQLPPRRERSAPEQEQQLKPEQEQQLKPEQEQQPLVSSREQRPPQRMPKESVACGVGYVCAVGETSGSWQPEQGPQRQRQRRPRPQQQQRRHWQQPLQRR